jgi:hypothetical protein
VSEPTTFCVGVRPALLSLRIVSFDSGRDDANVAPELEDQVVEIHRRHGAQGG